MKISETMDTESPSISTLTTSTEATTRVTPDEQCSIRIVATNSEFDALEDIWNTILNHADVTIFQTFEWVRTWWKYNATPHDQLHILLFTSGSDIVGIAPLFTQRKKFLGVRTITRLQFIACGLSDYVDFIILPGCEKTVLQAFAQYLHDHVAEWDMLDIEDVSEHSLLVQMLPAILEDLNIKIYQYQGNVCPRFQLPASVENLHMGLGRTTRHTLKRKIRKLQSEYKTELVLYRNESDDIASGIENFALIHGWRWKSQGFPSAFDDEKLLAYHVEVSKKFASRGWLRLYILKVNDFPIAVSYAFNFNRCIYMYHCNAYGPDDVMKHSPGMYVRNVAMTDGVHEGMRVFDYLRGNESYKYNEWPVIDTKVYLIRVSSPPFMSRLRFALFVVAELCKKSVSRIQREGYEYRKFTISKEHTVWEKCLYLGSRAVDLLVLGYNFLIRHAPLSLIQKLQIQRTPNYSNDAQKNNNTSKSSNDGEKDMT